MNSSLPVVARILGVVVTALTCGPLIVTAHAQCFDTPPGVVAWWPLDELRGSTAMDITSGVDGVHVNEPTPVPGMVDGGLHFDGVNDYVAVPDSELWALGSKDFTIEFWVRLDGPAHGTTGHPGDVFISSDDGPGTQDKWFFSLSSSHLAFHVNGPGIGSAFSPLAPFTPTPGSWYHLAVARAGTDYAIYVDGALVGEGQNAAVVPDRDAVLTIGRALEPFGGFLAGTMDEVTIHHRRLSETELLAIHAAGLEGKCKGISIISENLSAVQLGAPAELALEADGGVEPYTWTVASGALPEGLSLLPNGVISGKPTAIGSSSFVVRVTDSTGDFDEKELTATVLVVLPPPDLVVSKSGTITVPGRTVDYFIVIENKGAVTAEGTEVLELLLPSNLFTFSAASPMPDALDTASLMWILPPIAPGDIALVTYSVDLDPTIPFGVEVPGGVHVGGPGSAAAAAHEYIEQLADLAGADSGLPSCVDPACATLAIQCAKIYCGIPGLPWPQCVQCVEIARQCVEDCPDGCKFFPGSFEVDCQQATGPVDPNEKLVVDEKFVQPDETLVYAIHFENVGKVAALDVFLEDMLDPQLDYTSLEILTTEGASFDESTGLLSWDLLGIDLAPGAKGNVLFAIEPRDGLPSGTALKNDASIQFEVFETIITNEVVNIIDAVAPVGSVDTLPSQTAMTTFPLSWSGTDEVGEIAEYSVFVATNGGPYELLIDKSQQQGTLFTGAPGNRYDFFCVATDSAGNTEAPVIESEAFTEIVACAGSVSAFGTGLAGSGGKAPSLTLASCPLAETVVTIEIRDALSVTCGCLAFASSAGDAPFLGGSLLLDIGSGSFPILSHETDGAGSAELTLGVGPGTAGGEVFLQAFYLDPAAAEGVSMTNGVAVVIGS